MKNRIIIICTSIFLLYTLHAFSQEYRNSGFSKPMNLPFNLAGSFGEPRPDHFHSGIDIKTNGVEGEPVFAVYDGYISRIRVSPYGYGRAIYITHPNGFTTVYGHLSRFHGAIEKYIHAQQYALKKSELDLTLNASVFPLKQNDTIAFSGNTGGSDAPHLHFEIRNTKTEHALNPLDFYPRSFYVDTIPPQLNKVKIYYFDTSTFYRGVFSFIYDLKKIDSFYSTINAIQGLNFSNFAVSLEGFDKQDSSANKNGIKKIEIHSKNSLLFNYDLNEIDFDKTRMCNAFVDYNEMIKGNGYFYNCYQLKNNFLSIYKSTTNGLFSTSDSNTNYLNIVCYDYNNNATKIKLLFKDFLDSSFLSIVGIPIGGLVKTTTQAFYSDSIIKNDFKIKFINKSFYDDAHLAITHVTRYGNNLSSINIISDLNYLIPLQKSAKIEFKSSIKKNRNKIVVVRQNHKEKETALKTTFDKTKFYAETKELGTFYLKYDTTKPIVEILNPKSQIPYSSIQVKITDNLSGIDTYNGYIDNRWVNFYYDAKNDLIEYKFDEYRSKGEHLLKIIVTDKVGNKTIAEQKFTY